MRRKTLLNRNVIIVLMLFIFLMTAFVSTAYSFWYFPDSGNPKTVNADMKVDDIEENFTNTGSYLKIIDCRDGVIPNYDDFAIKSGSVFLDNSINFSDNGNTFRGKKGEDGKYRYSKKVFSVPSLNLRSFVSSVFYHSSAFYGSGTSVTDKTEIYLYDLLNSKYKLVDHLTNENIELRNKNGTSSDDGDMGEPLDAEKYSSTKFEDYRKNIGYPFSKSRILFLVPRNTETPPTVASDYNIYFHNEDPSDKKGYNKLGYVWLWNDRTDFGVSLPLNTDSTNTDGTSDKSLHIKYNALYEACNDFKDKNKKAGFIMTPQTAPTGIIFKTEDGTNFAPKDDSRNIEYLALPLPPKNSTSFNIYITADKDNGKFTISTNSTDPDVDLTKNKNIVFYSASGLDHLWMWSKSEAEAGRDVGRWISSNYVYKFKMTGFDKAVSCFSYNYGEKFNFYKKWKGPTAGPEHFTPGFTFDKKKTGEKKDYNYDSLVLVDYNNPDNGKTEDIDISGLFNGTSECTSIYLLEENKVVTKRTTSKDEFIKALKDLEKSESGSK